jgi:amino acid transporter
VLTSFSLAAIATNFKVKGGGDYYLISRSLGPEFGGAIGIVLFLAQSVSIAFYAIGFGEGVTAVVGVDWLTPARVAVVAIGLLFVLAWLGADWATRFQFGIMVLLCASLVTFAQGALGTWDGERLRANWEPGGELTFWAGFALFFPAVTGFTQGVSMSGDLRNPARSLPLGTFLAVGVSVAVYLGAAVLFSGAMPNQDLTAGYDAMSRVAAWPWVISGGVFAATLSSALASFLGAPRILQAMAKDRIFTVIAPMAKGQGPINNPRRDEVCSAGIAAIAIAAGDLNMSAPVV